MKDLVSAPNSQLLCQDILLQIKSFLAVTPVRSTIKSIKEFSRMELKLSLAFGLTKVDLSKMKQKYELLSKYKVYNKEYQWHVEDLEDENCLYVVRHKGHPILLDILFSSCLAGVATEADLGKTSQHCAWNTHLEEDLKLCIQLFPDSLNSTFGRIRCRYDLTPLYAACLNVTVPVSVIEILLQAGANMLITINVGYSTERQIKILEDISSLLENSKYEERISQIKASFSKFSTT